MIFQNDLPFPYPIWFDSNQKEQARKLIHLGFSYLGECQELTVNDVPLGVAENWAFYSKEGKIVALYEEAIYSSDIPDSNLMEVIEKFFPVIKTEEKSRCFYSDLVVGFGSNVEHFSTSQICYALNLVATWLDKSNPDLAPQLREIVLAMKAQNVGD